MDHIAPLGNEVISDEEVRQTEALIQRMRVMMTERDKGRVQQRDAHTKMHGLVRAEFRVPENLPGELRVGLFARPATYRAWVRWSNSASEVDADGSADIRGMGIKLMGVPGTKVLPAEADAPTHDFLLATAPNFPASTAGQTDTVLAAMLGGWVQKLVYGITHPWGAWIVFTTKVKHANLLQESFYSTVPYSFGGHAVKYILLPCTPLTDQLPFSPTPDFLRERLVEDLARGDASYDFCVQFQRDEESMPLDDERVLWSTKLSPPRKVATLRILQQTFDTEARNTTGENLAFTPWHCLPEHRPLGVLNRARRAVYETLSAYRHEKNGVRITEPSDWNDS